MTARINIVHKLYDRKGDVSRYMVKNGHVSPDEYCVYDAEGNFLYGIVVRQPWTVFRIFGHDGRLIYVGCTRTKNLKKRLGRMKLWKGKHTKAYQRALEGGKRPPKWIKPFDWIEAILLVEEEYPNRQQAEVAEKRYVRQMFPKSRYRLSTPGRRKFGPHKGTRKYIVNPQEPGKRAGKVFVQRTPSQKYLRKAKAFDGTYRPWEVLPGKYVNAARLGKGWEYINAARLDEKGRPTRLLFDASPYINACRWRALPERLEQDPGGEKHYRSLSERLKRHQTKMVLRDLSQRIVDGEGLSLAGPVDATPLTLKSMAHLTIPRDSRNRSARRRMQRTVVTRPRFIRLDIRDPNEEELRLFDDRPWRVPAAGKVRGFKWGRMHRADHISLKKPDTVHLPKKLANNPELLAKAISAVEEARELDSDKSKKVSPPTLVSSVFRNVETYQLGRWSVLKRHKARTTPPNEGKYEGLNEILAEIDGEVVNHGDRRIQEDTRFKWEWDEKWANKAVDAVTDDPPALPWTEAYRHVGQMLEREKLTKEERFAIALQLSNLLKRLRQRGTLKWGATDMLPDDQVPKRAVLDQDRAAVLCGVSPRTIKHLENIYEKLEPPTKRTLQKLYDGLRRVAEDGVEAWQDTGLPPAPAPKDPSVTGKPVADMTPHEYAAMLAQEIPSNGLRPLSKLQEWIVAVRRGREIISLNLNTLYRERYNLAGKEVEIKRDGILMGLGRKRYGSWEDLAQAAFLGLWKDAGHKHPDDTDKRRVDAPVKYSIFTRTEDGTLKPVFPADENLMFEAWAWKRGDSPASSARRRDRTHRQRQKSVGEQWKLDLLKAYEQATGEKMPLPRGRPRWVIWRC